MNDNKISLALAILKAGRSFEEASNISGIDAKKLIKLWEKESKK